MTTRMLLTNKQVMSAVELGCCVAMGTDEYVIGHACPAGSALGVPPPPADLRTYPGPDGRGFCVYVEALTPDGVAFLSLMEA